MLKKRKREDAEINGSSLADIAFLLLIFFLVTTTINVDTGIGLVLPPAPDDITEPPPIRQRNIMNILVDPAGRVLMDEAIVPIAQVRETLMEFIDNPNNSEELAESPIKAIVSIKTSRETPYRIYIDMLDEVKSAYRDLRNAAAQQRYGRNYTDLEDKSEAQLIVKDLYPQKISIAEPDDS